MWTRAELKQNAKVAFQRNRWLCVLVCLISSCIGGATYGWYGFDFTILFDLEELETMLSDLKSQLSMSELAMAREVFVTTLVICIVLGVLGVIGLTVFAGNIATVGGCRYFLENREHKTSVIKVFYGFGGDRYRLCLGTMFMRTLIVTAYGCLFVVPGVIKSYSYKLVPYILAENPEIGRKRALELSREMMDGHKWEAFVFDLSFLGWKLLGVCTMGIINIFMVEPYIAATFAEYYTALKSEAIYKGITDSEELPGMRVKEGIA